MLQRPSNPSNHDGRRPPRTSRRPTTRAALVGVAALMLLWAPACGTGSEQASAQMTSGLRPAPPTDEFAAPDEPGNQGNTDDPLDDLGDDLDDLTGQLGEAGDCASLGFAYAQLVVIAFTAEDAGTEIDAVIDELRQEVPDELQDELDVVAATLEEAGDGGFFDATDALSDPEFNEANDAIAAWITAECGG